MSTAKASSPSTSSVYFFKVFISSLLVINSTSCFVVTIPTTMATFDSLNSLICWHLYVMNIQLLLNFISSLKEHLLNPRNYPNRICQFLVSLRIVLLHSKTDKHDMFYKSQVVFSHRTQDTLIRLLSLMIENETACESLKQRLHLRKHFDLKYIFTSLLRYT